jgi:excisionase family DNA binding protein
MPDVLTLTQAAEYLQLHPETVRRLSREGILPGAKVGRSWRYRRIDLDDYLSRGGEKRAETGEKKLGL